MGDNSTVQPPPFCGASQMAVMINGQWQCVPINGNNTDPYECPKGYQKTTSGCRQIQPSNAPQGYQWVWDDGQNRFVLAPDYQSNVGYVSTATYGNGQTLAERVAAWRAGLAAKSGTGTAIDLTSGAGIVNTITAHKGLIAAAVVAYLFLKK